MRYAWHMRNDYLAKMRQPKKWAAELMLNRLRKRDKESSRTVTEFIAVSKNVQARIKQAYNRDSIVIYPPVECDRFCVSHVDEGYYLVISALVPYKRIDLAIEAFNNSGKKLVVVGKGVDLDYLKRIEAANIAFIENASDEQAADYLKKCRALIFPGEEDFGIVPLEAQACGKAVIAFGRGGALETVIALNNDEDRQTVPTGVFFYRQTPDDLKEAVLKFEENRDLFEPENCRKNAVKFDLPNYQSAMRNYIGKFEKKN
jgi:glycosyltransferase involved in cell wall biosynthesis